MTLSLTNWLTNWLLHIVEKHYHTALWETCDPWDMWWEWWGDMTWPKKSKTMTMQMTMTNTFREDPQRVILETFDLWDIWSECWGDMTWPTKRHWQRQRQWQRWWQRHLANTLGELYWRLLTFFRFWPEWWGDMVRPTKRVTCREDSQSLQCFQKSKILEAESRDTKSYEYGTKPGWSIHQSIL